MAAVEALIPPPVPGWWTGYSRAEAEPPGPEGAGLDGVTVLDLTLATATQDTEDLNRPQRRSAFAG